jgi:DNA-directed RNA polymerase subunit RPC12/RpoP
MAEYKCPECGEVLDSQPAYAGNLLCVSQAQWFAKSYVEGYWTRDREENEKRCENCRYRICVGGLPDCGHEPLVSTGRDSEPDDDFRCKFWQPK